MPSGYIQLMIDPHTTFENGDILSAANSLTVRRAAASRICFERIGTRQFAGLNGSGFLPNAHLLKDWHDACCEFRLERLNTTQCKQVRLSDMAEITITTGVPHTDLKGKPDRQMDVDLYFKRRIDVFKKQNAQGKAIFSDDGDELKVVLYGGGVNPDVTAMNIVWAAITSKTGKLQIDETTYDKEPPFGSRQHNRIVLRVNDFTDAEKEDLTAFLEDVTDPENPIFVKKRKSWVDWEGSLAFPQNVINDIRNPGKDPNLRTVQFPRSSIVNTKTI